MVSLLTIEAKADRHLTTETEECNCLPQFGVQIYPKRDICNFVHRSGIDDNFLQINLVR
jgi:hypothetical protein